MWCTTDGRCGTHGWQGSFWNYGSCGSFGGYCVWSCTSTKPKITTTTTTTTTNPCGPEIVEGNGQGYRGCQTRTLSGKTCQMWTSQTPHAHNNTPESKPNMGLGHHNFCRNPSGNNTIGCYTMDPSTRWESCMQITTTTTTTTTPDPPTWVLGPVGENCYVTCAEQGCAGYNQWPRSEGAFKSILKELNHTSCTSIDTGDWSVNPAQYQDYDNMCFWSTPENDCAGSKYGVKRFCPCKGQPTTTTSTTTTTTTITTTTITSTTITSTTTTNTASTTSSMDSTTTPLPSNRRRGSGRRRRRTVSEVIAINVSTQELSLNVWEMMANDPALKQKIVKSQIKWLNARNLGADPRATSIRLIDGDGPVPVPPPMKSPRRRRRRRSKRRRRRRKVPPKAQESEALG